MSAAIIGGQGLNVLLESSDVDYDGVGTFSADVTVLNLIASALGTADGETAHADGVRIFFLAEPTVTAGSGTVTVANATGTTAFTVSGQPYFQFDAPISPMQRSNVMTWAWNVPNTVQDFTFSVGVSAEVPGDGGTVGPRLNASRISAFTRHSCALDSEGAAYCWGYGIAGRLGDGSTTDRPTPVPVAGGHVFSSINAGFTYTCALTDEGEAYCWGYDDGGSLGNGSRTTRTTPYPVSTFTY